MQIRDPESFWPGSWMEKLESGIKIPETQHCVQEQKVPYKQVHQHSVGEYCTYIIRSYLLFFHCLLHLITHLVGTYVYRLLVVDKASSDSLLALIPAITPNV
jgi:hypothetical protein